MIDLGLNQGMERFRNTEKDLLSLFYSSSTSKSSKEFRFAKIDSNFISLLPYLNDGAVKLYLYYMIAANSNTGESWHSADTISRKLHVTERSIANWNNQLEDLGLIYRTNNKRKSKATFVLPLTGFAVKMDGSKIEQVLNDLDLCDTNTHSKVFGKYQAIIRLYITNEVTKKITEVLCVHLKRITSVANTVLNTVDIYIYNTCDAIGKGIEKALASYKEKDKVAMINGAEKISLGRKTFEPYRCFFINVPTKVDDAAIYDIMSQLTGDGDFSGLKQITITEEV